MKKAVKQRNKMESRSQPLHIDSIVVEAGIHNPRNEKSSNITSILDKPGN